jgi:hypothetical protein
MAFSEMMYLLYNRAERWLFLTMLEEIDLYSIRIMLVIGC